MMQAASDALSDNAVYTRDVATADAVTPLVAKEDVDSGSSWHGKRASNVPELGFLFVLLLSLGFLTTAFLSFTHKDAAQASQCEMAWMSPSYLRLNGFNESHSRLASKYSLWFYREQGYDLSNKVRPGDLSTILPVTPLCNGPLTVAMPCFAHCHFCSLATRCPRPLCAWKRRLLPSGPQSGSGSRSLILREAGCASS
jgi:hypothetical protein